MGKLLSLETHSEDMGRGARARARAHRGSGERGADAK